MSGNNGGGTPLKLTVAMVEAALEAVGGIKTAASLILNVHRSTLYRFIDNNPELKDFCAEINEQTKDLAEGKVLTAMKDGDMQTVRWYLDRMARDRGYGHINVDLGNKDDKPFKVAGATTLDLTKLTQDQKKALLTALKPDEPQS